MFANRIRSRNRQSSPQPSTDTVLETKGFEKCVECKDGKKPMIVCQWILILVTAAALFYYYAGYHSNMATMDQSNTSLHRLEAENRKISESVEEKSRKIRELSVQLSSVQSETRHLNDELNSMKDRHSLMVATTAVGDAAPYADTAVATMIAKIQKNDLLFLQNKYGSNDALQIVIDTSLGEIRIETAPIKVMPHSIRYFTTLVESHFWDGCHFFRNARHVIQANCHHRTPKHSYNPSVTFQEYSPTYTHSQRTVGIAGRPGGPDFYVSTIDNVDNHGPGGQDAQADPCWGTVVSGWDTVLKIHTIAPDPKKAMNILADKDWVEFKSVRVLTRDEIAAYPKPTGVDLIDSAT